MSDKTCFVLRILKSHRTGWYMMTFVPELDVIDRRFFRCDLRNLRACLLEISWFYRFGSLIDPASKTLLLPIRDEEGLSDLVTGFYSNHIVLSPSSGVRILYDRRYVIINILVIDMKMICWSLIEFYRYSSDIWIPRLIILNEGRIFPDHLCVLLEIFSHFSVKNSRISYQSQMNRLL
jgi:hypothetical protein